MPTQPAYFLGVETLCVADAGADPPGRATIFYWRITTLKSVHKLENLNYYLEDLLYFSTITTVNKYYYYYPKVFKLVTMIGEQKI